MPDREISFEHEGRRIAVSARVCDSFFSRGLGKMFSRSRQPILFPFDREQDVWIHMHWVFMRLLVVWLDAEMKPVKVRKMTPFISMDHARAKFVLEIPQ
jgi:uncharacterized membrane protein (UPF0127 family)